MPNTCQAGTYCPEGSADASECNIGYFSSFEGSPDQEYCVECLDGSYCDETGLPKGKPCPQGRYCPYSLDIDPTYDDEYICPVGHYCEGDEAYGQPCFFRSFNPEEEQAKKVTVNLVQLAPSVMKRVYRSQVGNVQEDITVRETTQIHLRVIRFVKLDTNAAEAQQSKNCVNPVRTLLMN